MNELSKIKAYLIDTEICRAPDFVGGEEKDIVTLENWMGEALPQEYKDFYRCVGRGAGSAVETVYGFSRSD